MSETQKIKEAILRTKKALTLRPAFGKGTSVSKVWVTEGLTFEIQEGQWKLRADMPEAVGGNGFAPTLGVYGRAALGSCLAIGYMMKAAELDIPINSLVVEVEADFDDGGLLWELNNIAAENLRSNCNLAKH